MIILNKFLNIFIYKIKILMNTQLSYLLKISDPQLIIISLKLLTWMKKKKVKKV